MDGSQDSDVTCFSDYMAFAEVMMTCPVEWRHHIQHILSCIAVVAVTFVAVAVMTTFLRAESFLGQCRLSSSCASFQALAV